MKRKPGYDPEFHRRSKEAIAHGALTNSKRPECLVEGVYPTHLVSGLGGTVKDLAGNSYVDYICGLGTNLFGYANGEIEAAIIKRLSLGTSLSLGTPLEVEMAEKVKEILPWVERVRFLKTGSEACLAAIRIARAATDRPQILTSGYHGWGDPFVSTTKPGLGLKDQFRIETLTALEQIGPSTAAVIIEPVELDYSPKRIEVLRDLKARCREMGALLIFDEIITGMRFKKFTVSNATGIEPDIICLGKAIAGGMPLSVVAGKKDVMECAQYFVSSTFAGETLSLAAGIKTIELLQKKYKIDELWSVGRGFYDFFNSFNPSLIHLNGYPVRGRFAASSPETLGVFFQECALAGLLVGPSFFICFSHLDNVDWSLSTLRDIINKIEHQKPPLVGKLPESPFAQKVREQS